jgi:long-subunit acyl-CoA synthetase (AMP-forming)
MVCMGYLVDKDKPDPDVVKKNVEEFSTCALGHRWFHTGDIGQITVDGQLQIIDRKKDLVKLQMGEYVALSKVENVLKECPLVELPLCYADSKEKFCVALVCPSHVALKALGRSLGLGEDVPTLCANKQIIAEVSKQCLAVCKPKLVGFEIPKVIGLVLTLTLTLPEPEPEPEPSP